MHGRPSEADAPSLGCFLPSNNTFPDRGTFQFRDRGEDRKYHFPSRCAGIDALFQAYEVNA